MFQNEQWVTPRKFIYYVFPPLKLTNGDHLPGAKQKWLEYMSNLLDDIWWLCELQYHQWGNYKSREFFIFAEKIWQKWIWCSLGSGHRSYLIRIRWMVSNRSCILHRFNSYTSRLTIRRCCYCTKELKKQSFNSWNVYSESRNLMSVFLLCLCSK